MSVKRNTTINLLGSVVPIIVSLLTVPLYLHRIGDARYGILTIVWLLVGYFGLFDLGLSRATANQIAKYQDAPASRREEVFWTALVINGLLGVVGGIGLFAVAHLAFGTLFKVSLAIRPELIRALPWVALAVPVATMSGVLTGSLEGRNRFGTLNGVQVLGTILSQTVPLSVAFLRGPSLAWLIPSAVLARIVSTVPLIWTAIRQVPLSGPRWPSKEVSRALMGYGLWVAVTNLISPILDAADRLVIGATLGVRSVTYYAIPYSLASRVSILPAAVSRTLFPLLSSESTAEGTRLAEDAVRALAAILTPVVVAGIVIIHPFLTIWVGSLTAERSFAVGEIILVGAWMNGLAFLPFTQLQGQSRPDLVAKFHLIELLPFIGILWTGIRTFGLVGGASAWSLRVATDAILLFWASGYGSRVVWSLLPAVALVIASCLFSFLLPFPNPLCWVIGGAFFTGSICWAVSFKSPVRSQLLRIWQGIRLGVARH